MLKTATAAFTVVAVAALVSPAVAHSTNLRSELIERQLEDAAYMAIMTGTPQCIIESGFDFVGEDISTTKHATAEACCSSCSATPGCKAFSWTDGTCYLKRNRGKVVVNPAVRSALVIPGQRATGELKASTDIVGNNIGAYKNYATADLCVDLCRKSLGCRSFTWTSENNGTCYLKSGRGDVVLKAEAISADVYPATSYEASLFNVKQANVDFVGQDIGNLKSANADGCFQPCRENRQCVAFTWTKYNGGTCWLKSGNGAFVNSVGAISGSLDFVSYSGEVLANTDFVGNDIGNVRDLSTIACGYRCLNYVDGCKAVTWTSYNGGTCWFKSAAGARVTVKDAASFVMS